MFTNQPNTLDFDAVTSRESVQDLTLTKDQVLEGSNAYFYNPNWYNLFFFFRLR